MGTLLISLILIAVPLGGQTPAIPIDRIMAAPFPSGLSAAPSGGAVAWVQNKEGARNIMIASPPDYRPRQATAFTLDDGQEIAGIQWAPNGGTMFFVRGGGANRAGESPNPMSDPAGAEQTLMRVAAGGGAVARVAQGSGLAVAPVGGQIAFTRRGQIWLAPLDSGAAPTQLANLRGASGSLRWSPDGSKLAFVSGRGDHAFVGVIDVAARTVRWMAPSVDTDNSPVWSPDGSRLAFIRIPASSRLDLFKPVRHARPWSIMVADVATGVTRAVWTAEPGAGSAFRGIVGDQLLWGAGDRLIFPWERTGWTSLYSISTSGGSAVLLTPGDFEVEYVELSPDRRQVLYNSNQGDIDRRDIWRASVAGGAPVAVTRSKDIEWEPVMTSDGRAVAFLRSGSKTPAHPAIIVGTAAPRELAPGILPPDFPTTVLVEPQAVHFAAADGMRIPAQLFLPGDIRPGEKRPAVIYFHGGSRRQMLLGFNYSSYYHNAYAFNQHLASKGYVVLSVNYRSGIGYGMEFREALNYGASGGSEFNDVIGAGLYLASRGDVDARRIGLWGGSYGGYLTAMGLSRASNLFAAGVDIHGVHDWNVGIRTFVPSYNPLENPENTRLAFNSSPMSTIDSWRSPVLVIHGDDDRNVSFAETVTLVEALRQRNVEVEQLVFPDEVHSFLRHENWLAAYRAAAEFFDRRLAARSP